MAINIDVLHFATLPFCVEQHGSSSCSHVPDFVIKHAMLEEALTPQYTIAGNNAA
jgi:hypothetical protein